MMLLHVKPQIATRFEDFVTIITGNSQIQMFGFNMANNIRPTCAVNRTIFARNPRACELYGMFLYDFLIID